MLRSNTPSRGSITVAAIGLLAAAGAWLVLKPHQASSSSSLEGSNASPTEAPPAAQTQAASEDSELQPQSPSERAKAPPAAAVVVQPISRPLAPAPASSQTEPSPYSRQLVAGLATLDSVQGPISKEQAQQWKQTFQGLISQGAAAVPAIREFLEMNHELNFAALSGAEQLGQSSLRSAMINALAQIGGPEAISVMLQTLQTTALPSEIAQLAQVLEAQSPGQYRQETINAVNEVLAMAGKGQLAGYDVGPLFQVLRNYGDAATASELEQLSSGWKYYAALSLAGLPAGAGVPSLIRQVQDSATGSQRDFAFQMLAQGAGQNQDASAALIELARLNQIPDNAWRKIAMGLAGDQFLLGTPPVSIPPDAPPPPGLKTYHIQSGNQNFYSLPLAADGQVNQRLGLIAQLLNATSNPLAVTALQNARDSLSVQTSVK